MFYQLILLKPNPTLIITDQNGDQSNQNKSHLVINQGEGGLKVLTIKDLDNFLF